MTDESSAPQLAGSGLPLRTDVMTSVMARTGSAAGPASVGEVDGGHLRGDLPFWRQAACEQRRRRRLGCQPEPVRPLPGQVDRQRRCASALTSWRVCAAEVVNPAL